MVFGGLSLNRVYTVLCRDREGKLNLNRRIVATEIYVKVKISLGLAVVLLKCTYVAD